MTTRTFTTACAQGDVHFTKVAGLPKGMVEARPKDGRVIVAHSETGHNHEGSAQHFTMYEDPNNPLRCFLLVPEIAGDAVIVHKRPFDTHDPIAFKPGVYEVRRQREYVPEGFRRVED